MTEDNNGMLQQMGNFNDNFPKLHAELVVTKRVNSELCKRMVTTEVSAGKIPSFYEENL